jgi:hypothetical protein
LIRDDFFRRRHYDLSLMDKTGLRAENGALEYLLNYYARRDKFTQAVECLPDLADRVFQHANDITATLLKPTTLSDRVKSVLADKQKVLSMCVFDLMLVSCFSEILEYSEDNEFSSVFVDALLYQATGQETGVPTEEQVRHEGTLQTRGIAKYKVASNYISKNSVRDLEGWIFGKEYSCVVSGSSTDFGRIMAVGPITILIRAEGTWDARFFLYGTLPSKDDREKIDILVHDSYANMDKLLSGLRGYKQESD